ncbi:MAG: hypothetical protein ACJAV1_002477 [Paraglaciecola sp.]|jgi:hypothetical protein
MIEPDTTNSTCPDCDGELNIQPMNSEEDTTCSCGYSEPAGSAHFITFLSEVLERFTENLGVKRHAIGSMEFNAGSVLLTSTGILPAVMLNAKVNEVSSKLTDNAMQLSLVDDENGLYKKRLVTTGKITNPSLILTTLGETIFQVWKQSMTNDYNNKHSVIDFNNLAPIGVLNDKALTDINEVSNSTPEELMGAIMEHLQQ